MRSFARAVTSPAAQGSSGLRELAFWSLAVGAPIGVLFLAATQLDAKWFSLLFSGCLIAIGSLAVRERKHYYLLLLVLTIPVGIDLNIMFRQSTVNRSTYGFLITLSHISLVALLILDLKERFAARLPLDISTKGLMPLAGLFAVAAISVGMARSQLFGAFDLFALATSILLFSCVSWCIRDTRELRLAVAGIVFTMGAQGILAIAQYLTSSSLGLDFFGAQKIMHSYAGLQTVSRAAGTLGHPNSLALFLDLLLPLSLLFLFCPMKSGMRTFVAASFVLGLFGLMATLSRGGIFCTSAALGLAVLLKWRKYIGFVRAVFILAFALGLCAVVVLSTSNPIQQRFFKNDYGNAHGRVTLAKVAFNLIRHNPLLGVGLNNYTDTAQFYDHTPEQIVSNWNAPVHNLILFIAGETGLPGVIFFSLFLLSILLALLPAVSSPDPLLSNVGVGTLMGFLAFFAHTQVDYCHWTHFIPLWLMAGLAVSTGRIAARNGTAGSQQ